MRGFIAFGIAPMLVLAVPVPAWSQSAPALVAKAPQPAPQERLVLLEQASNFRDLGGYQTVEGKRVRWGRLYRSGAQPMLTDADVAMVHSLDVRNIIDLRSSEERVLAPTRLDGIPYHAVGYSFTPLMGLIEAELERGGVETAIQSMYGVLPEMIRPQLRLLFARLLDGEGATLFNCSAGQDRTGLAAALILTALGVDRQTVYADYLLSERYRQTRWEVAPIPSGLAATNPVYAYFARYRAQPETAKPPSLSSSKGEPYLKVAMDQIERRSGSVTNYLHQDIGLTDKDIERLKALYLE